MEQGVVFIGQQNNPLKKGFYTIIGIGDRKRESSGNFGLLGLMQRQGLMGLATLNLFLILN